MRCTTAVWSLLLLRICFAAPTAPTSDQSKPGLTLGHSTVGGRLDKLLKHSARSSSATTPNFATWSSSAALEQARIVVACQECSAVEVDIYPSFQVQAAPQATSECGVVLSINGTATSIDQAENVSSIDVTSYSLDVYHFEVTLSCGFDRIDGAFVKTPVISAALKSFNDRSLLDHPGFTISISPQATISSIRISYEIVVAASSVVSSISIPDRLLTTQEDAKRLLDRVQTARNLQQNSSYFIADIDAPHPHKVKPLFATNTSDIETSKCSKYFNYTVAYTIKRFRAQICGTLQSLLSRFEVEAGQTYSTEHQSRVQEVMTNMKSYLDCKKQNATNDYKELNTTAASFDAGNRDYVKIEVADTPNALVRVLELLAATIGLGTLLAFIKRRCCSLRRRVERLADREERVKAREYKRAARQEARRKRWASLRRACTCCFSSSEHEATDIEKQVLLADHSAMEYQTPDANMQEVLTSLDGLHYAHEIVANMVQLQQVQHNTTSRLPDPATTIAVIDMAYKRSLDRTTRSRTSSLPSYDSDILPDYSSQPETVEAAYTTRIANGFRPRAASPSSSAASSARTPDSSIPDISPRPSVDTSRTGSSTG